ncbi:hypothetical protein [Hyphobacterium sp.]|uniref:hypothetical protein n=1 Tax=Hyphobacterium sp. TaxID=2004662 RepID=UPI003748642A
MLGNAVVSAPVFSQSLPDPDSQTAAFIESNIPGALGLLNTYQLALNECDAVLFEQVVNNDAWIVGFPTDSARQLGGNTAWFESLCEGGGRYDVQFSPPSALYLEGGYILVIQIGGSRLSPAGDEDVFRLVVSLYVREIEADRRMIIYSHSSRLPEE